MTVLTNKTRNDYVGTGGVTTYAYQFKIFNDSELLVYRTDEFGNATLLTLTTDYTVTGAGDAAGGEIELTTALPNNYTLAILRNLPLTQETAFRNQGAFYPARHEDAFDKTVMLAQQISEELGRVVVAPPSTNPGVSFQLPAPDPDHILGWNTAGTALENKTGISTDGMLDLANQVDPAKGAALVGWLPNMLNGIGRPLSDRLLDYVNVKDFGAVGDGITDDTDAIQAAIDTGYDVEFPKGVYLCGALSVTLDGQVLFSKQDAIILANSDSIQQITIEGDKQKITGLKFHGIATSQNATLYFAIYTTTTPATNLTISDCTFSSNDNAIGHRNCIKLTIDCHGAIIINNRIERMHGYSLCGYAILVSDSSNCIICNNIIIGDISTQQRGRHGIYLSAGCNYCLVYGNYIEGTYEAGITCYSQGVQALCEHNIVAFNTIISCSHASNFSGGGITIGGKCANFICALNYVKDSGSKGITFDSTNFGTSISPIAVNNKILNNTVINSGHFGIALLNNDNFIISGNDVINSSIAAVGSYSHICLDNDAGGFACQNGLIIGNSCKVSSNTRSSFYINAAFAATGLTVYGNKFPVCNLTDIELGISIVPINGYLYAVKSWDIPSLATLTQSSTTIPVLGAAISDIVHCTLRANSTSEMVAGLILTAFVSAADTVTVTVANLTTGTIDPSNSVLTVAVLKR